MNWWFWNIRSRIIYVHSETNFVVARLSSSIGIANLIFLKGCLSVSATLGAVMGSHVISRQKGRDGVGTISRALSRNSDPPIGETGCISCRYREGKKKEEKKCISIRSIRPTDRIAFAFTYILRRDGRIKCISAKVRAANFSFSFAFSSCDSIPLKLWEEFWLRLSWTSCGEIFAIRVHNKSRQEDMQLI